MLMHVRFPVFSRRSVLRTALASAGLLFVPARLLAASPTVAPVRALAFDGDSLLAAGEGLYRSDDGGISWSLAPLREGVLALTTHPERLGRIVAGLTQGGVVVSEDGGQSWESRARGLAEGAVSAIAVAASRPDTLYASVQTDGLWKSEDAGRSWILAIDRPWLLDAERDVTALASVQLATGMGGIWIYAGTELGLTRVPDCFCRWQDVQAGDAMDALVSGVAPPSASPLPVGEPIRSLVSAPSAPETLYAALPSGVWTSGDAGVTWSRLIAGQALALAVHAVDARLIAAALEGGLKTSHDGGVSWSDVAAI